MTNNQFPTGPADLSPRASSLNRDKARARVRRLTAAGGVLAVLASGGLAIGIAGAKGTTTLATTTAGTSGSGASSTGATAASAAGTTAAKTGSSTSSVTVGTSTTGTTAATTKTS